MINVEPFSSTVSIFLNAESVRVIAHLVFALAQTVANK